MKGVIIYSLITFLILATCSSQEKKDEKTIEKSIELKEKVVEETDRKKKIEEDYRKEKTSKTEALTHELWFAIGDNDLAKAKKIIEEGAKINDLIPLPHPLSGAVFPLGEAVKKNNLEMVKLLLDMGADPNFADYDGCTALFYAAIYSDKEIIELLIKYGADINLKNKYNTTALFGATNNNRPEITKYLLENGADFKVKNIVGKTVLMYAKEKGLTEIIKILEEAGAKE